MDFGPVNVKLKFQFSVCLREFASRNFKWKGLNTAQCFQPKAAEWPDCREGSEKPLQRMMSPPRMSVCWAHLFCTLRSNQATIQTGHFKAIWSMSYLWMCHVVCAQEGWLFYQKPAEWRSPARLAVGTVLLFFCTILGTGCTSKSSIYRYFEIVCVGYNLITALLYTYTLIIELYLSRYTWFLYKT